MNQARIERVMRVQRAIEALNVPYVFQPPATLCGCGRIAVYAVYKDKQPHCRFCLVDAIDSDDQVLVGRLR